MNNNYEHSYIADALPQVLSQINEDNPLPIECLTHDLDCSQFEALITMYSIDGFNRIKHSKKGFFIK